MTHLIIFFISFFLICLWICFPSLMYKRGLMVMMIMIFNHEIFIEFLTKYSPSDLPDIYIYRTFISTNWLFKNDEKFISCTKDSFCHFSKHFNLIYLYIFLKHRFTTTQRWIIFELRELLGCSPNLTKALKAYTSYYTT